MVRQRLWYIFRKICFVILQRKTKSYLWEIESRTQTNIYYKETYRDRYDPGGIGLKQCVLSLSLSRPPYIYTSIVADLRGSLKHKGCVSLPRVNAYPPSI
jgi:hypothetical protein